jgi:hypothetical protein
VLLRRCVRSEEWCLWIIASPLSQKIEIIVQKIAAEKI